MKTRCNLVLLICSLLISNLVFSQQKSDTASIESRFLFPQFTDGVVTLKDGTIFLGKLNYDTSLDEMQFIGSDNVIMAIAEPEKVIKLEIANRNFIYINKYFVEILSDDPISLCLRVHLKRTAEKIGAYGGVSPSASIDTYSSLQMAGANINTKLARNEQVSFKKEFYFYVMINGKMKFILNHNDLLKCFPSNKVLLKQELERQHTKFNSIDSMKKIVDWINANGIKN